MRSARRTSARRTAAALLLGVALSACSDDPEPSSRSASSASPSARPSASATAPPSTAASPTASSAPSPSAGATTGAAPRATPTRAAAPGPTSAPAAPAPAAPAPGSGRPARLTGDGLDLPQGVVPFGTSVETALPTLTAALGRPTRDTGVGSSFGVYGTCPGTRLQALEWGGGALVVLFGDVSGSALSMYAWRLTGQGSAAGLPRPSALVGDVSTFEFGVGTTVTALRDGAGGALEVLPGDEIVGPSFRVRDQSSGFFGSLSGTRPQDTVTSVSAGRPCGD